MITDMLKQIHAHRHRNHISAPKKDTADASLTSGDKPTRKPYKRSASVVEMDIEAQDVIDNMLAAIADFQKNHKDATRMVLVRCIAELKKDNRYIIHPRSRLWRIRMIYRRRTYLQFGLNSTLTLNRT